MIKPLTIGRLAHLADVNVETVRYYQRLGLIQKPSKPLTGYRIYSLEIVDRIRFIKRAQTLGFCLKEISELLALGDAHCADVRKRAELKRDRIEQQIKDLTRLCKTLDMLIDSCHHNGDSVHCPIVETLAGKRS